VAALAVYLTGDGAEDIVKHLPDVSRAIIDRHEDAALVATIAAGAFGLAALVALLLYRTHTPPRWLGRATFLAAFVPVVFMGWAANLGGQIRHTEIRPGASSVTATPTSNASNTARWIAPSTLVALSRCDHHFGRRQLHPRFLSEPTVTPNGG